MKHCQRTVYCVHAFGFKGFKMDRVRLMYVSVDGYAFWLPSTLLQQQRLKKTKQKKTWTDHSLMFNASAVCWNMSSHLFHHHPGADSARVQVRPEQHTLLSVFKLN